MSQVKWVVGMKVRFPSQPEWGVGHLCAISEDGTKAQVDFPNREGGPVWVSTRQNSLLAHVFVPQDAIVTHKGRAAEITEEVEGGRGLRRYAFRYSDTQEEGELPESEIRAAKPKSDLLHLLKEGQVADAQHFQLRKTALHLDDERRCDALGALFTSRVMVKPHQVGVVQRVLSARRPRFILADEVGLGKTIEAGMIASALRLSGLANRVLVVAPSHLTVQWLAEMFHKFNQLFTLMDSERFASSQTEQPHVSPWARYDKVVTSLEMLSRGDTHRKLLEDPSAHWDLVIVDEAHHLKGEKAFAAARELARNCWGLLLLTATPMQLDPSEYHSLLTLIDEKTAPSLEGFEERLRRQEEVSEAVRGLLEKNDTQAVRLLAKRFPSDKKLATLQDSRALLSHVSETYSLSDRLIRNRRVKVGGFSGRRLHRHRVELSDAEKKARLEALDVLRGQKELRGAPLANLIRRLESSSAAFLSALSSNKSLSSRTFALPEKDTRFAAFVAVLRKISAQEPSAKVLVFTESRDTLEFLQVKLRDERLEALAYHGDLPLIERDRQVARFRDPEGPRILLCTEVGGEGRNFQFAHHLVNYDLPWSPSTLEQRIGRLDRIGQAHPVDIHVFDIPGTLSQEVLDVMADAVGVFGETVGGLDSVLEEVEPQLMALALAEPKERAAWARTLKKNVEEARERVKRAYDPLLDLRSFDEAAVAALVKKAHHRFGLEVDDEMESDEALPNLEEGLWSLARDLDERLEDTVTELARRVGIGVDTDEQVEAFQCAFQFGHALKVEALPGFSIMEDKTVLGTFWRDSAVEQEEIEYFATGHPIVESLFGFLRDGPYGRNGFRYVEMRGPQKARGIEFLFHLHAPEPQDTSPGSRVPSRQLSRFLDEWLVHVPVVQDAGGNATPDASWQKALEKPGRSLKGDEIRQAFPDFARFVEPAAVAAKQAAEQAMHQRAQRAQRAIDEEKALVLERLSLSLAHQGLPEAQAREQIAAEEKHYAALSQALKGLRVELDSACGFVVNR